MARLLGERTPRSGKPSVYWVYEMGDDRLELLALTIKRKAEFALEKLLAGDIERVKEELESIIRVLEGIIYESKRGGLQQITL